LNVTLPKGEVWPGSNFKISVKTTPKAFVGLLAVDKAVLLHKKGNDLDKNRVLDLLRYDPSSNYEPLKVIGSQSVYRELGGLNSFILTDALNLPQRKTVTNRFYGSEESMEDYEYFDFQTPEADVESTNKGQKRKNFPETWIFDTFSVDSSGGYSLQKRVPDSITSWIVTGFSLDKENGLGISDPQSLIVRQNLFIKLNLPYSIRWGEILKVEVTVFNYVPDRKINLSVEVELFTEEDDQDFEFIDARSKCVYETSSDTSRKTLISVASNSMSSTSFFVKPLKIGEIKLNVRATGQQLKIMDEVEKKILVESEGITQFTNHLELIDLSKGAFEAKSVRFTVEDDAIPKSVRAGVTVDADLMGSVLMDVTSLM
jgi:CD109 antigen